MSLTPWHSAHDDETKAFYAAYQNDLEDQDDDLKHLNIVHDHIPGIEDAADPVGDEDVDIEGDIQEASWKRDAGVSDSHVEEEEEHHPSPETGAERKLSPLEWYRNSAHLNPLSRMISTWTALWVMLTPPRLAPCLHRSLRRRTYDDVQPRSLRMSDDLHYPVCCTSW
jgi:hypothetical protein